MELCNYSFVIMCLSMVPSGMFGQESMSSANLLENTISSDSAQIDKQQDKQGEIRTCGVNWLCYPFSSTHFSFIVNLKKKRLKLQLTYQVKHLF